MSCFLQCVLATGLNAPSFLPSSLCPSSKPTFWVTDWKPVREATIIRDRQVLSPQCCFPQNDRLLERDICQCGKTKTTTTRTKPQTMGALASDCVQFPGWSHREVAALSAQPQPCNVLCPRSGMWPAVLPTLFLFHTHFLACNPVLRGDIAHIKNAG